MGRYKNSFGRKASKNDGGLGRALIRRLHAAAVSNGGVSHLHTTEADDDNSGALHSIVERNDLDELMALADLQGRDFAAERGVGVAVIVQMPGAGPAGLGGGAAGAAAGAADAKARAKARAAAEAEHAHLLRVPRRPAWTASTTPEQLEQAERDSFLDWRRALAALEDDDRLTMMPFEKNLDVWRQLWRVLERSDIVVQVVDARNPMFYRCEDLEAYAREQDIRKRSILLLNKADLLPPSARRAWAEYLTARGLPHLFWSAKQATEDAKAEALAELGEEDEEEDDADADEDEDEGGRRRGAAGPSGRPAASGAGLSAGGASGEVHVYSRDELLVRLEELAAEAVTSLGGSDPREGPNGRRLMVGLVGFPNVGKSSTINAMRGEKKAGVTATPGKTKHFQTLHMSSTLCVCDCPGLVFPSFTQSKAEMAAAGVLPIDRLTDVRGPATVVAERVPRAVLEAVYGLTLPRGTGRRGAPPTGAELLRAYALSRNLVAHGGLPDETRAGRTIIKDFISGKIPHCLMPPVEMGADAEGGGAEAAEVAAEGGRKERPARAATPAPAAAAAVADEDDDEDASSSGVKEEDEEEDDEDEEDEEENSVMGHEEEAAGLRPEDLLTPGSAEARQLSAARRGVLRPAHKFQKKALPGGATKTSKREAARNHRRAVVMAQAAADGTAAGLDGTNFLVGKKGGLVRAPGSAASAAPRLATSVRL